MTRDLICRDRRIPAESIWPVAYRDDLRELCQRHGEDSENVNWAEYDLIDAPLLRFGVYLTNDEGRRYLSCGCAGRFERRDADGNLQGFHDGPCTVAMRTTEHALVGALPHWWKP